MDQNSQNRWSENFKKFLVFLIVLFIFSSIVAYGSGNKSGTASNKGTSIKDTSNKDTSNKDTSISSSKTKTIDIEELKNRSQEEMEEPVEETPDIELSTDFEKAAWEIVKNNNGKLHSIESIISEDSEETTVVAVIFCENDENVVNTILSELSEIIKNNDTNESGLFTFGDIEKDEDAPLLVSAGIFDDGTITISTTGQDYNSERNRWIKNQFSAWSGAHRELEKLIIRNLNDEKSYEHIETTYRDVKDESVRDVINQALEDGGYSQRVEVGDLFIVTVFSAKNGFGGTIKNKAIGISSYHNDTTTLIDIG